MTLVHDILELVRRHIGAEPEEFRDMTIREVLDRVDGRERNAMFTRGDVARIVDSWDVNGAICLLDRLYESGPSVVDWGNDTETSACGLEIALCSSAGEERAT